MLLATRPSYSEYIILHAKRSRKLFPRTSKRELATETHVSDSLHKSKFQSCLPQQSFRGIPWPQLYPSALRKDESKELEENSVTEEIQSKHRN